MTSHQYVLNLTTWFIVSKQDIQSIGSSFIHVLYYLQQDISSIDTHFQPYDLSLNWSDIPELVVPVRNSLTTGCCCLGSCWTKDTYWFIISSKVLRLPRWLASPLRNIFVAMYPGYVTRIVSNARSFPLSWLIGRFVTRIALWVPLVEQELLTLFEYLSSFSILLGIVLLDL